jgi:hypothetical protein
MAKIIKIISGLILACNGSTDPERYILIPQLLIDFRSQIGSRALIQLLSDSPIIFGADT